jgi:hypothetical protein
MSLTVTSDKTLAWGDSPINIITSTELSLETSYRIASDTSLSNSLSLEVSNRLSSDNSLEKSLSNALLSEVSSRVLGDASLSTGLSSEVSNRLSSENSLENSLSNALLSEVSSRVLGDAGLSTELSSEVSSRISGTTSINNLFGTSLSLQNLLVQCDTQILGNLTVTGTVTSVILNTQNVDIKDNLIGLNIGAAELSVNYKDTGIICERGSTQKNVFSGFKESNDKYSIFYTNDNSKFIGTDLSIDNYVDFQVKNIEFVDGSCNSLVIQGTNIVSALSSEISSRVSGDASLTNSLSSESSSRVSGDTSLTNALSSESSSRVSGDASLSLELSYEVSERRSGDANLSLELSSEVSERMSGDVSLSNIITKKVSSLGTSSSASSGIGPGMIWNPSGSAVIYFNNVRLGTTTGIIAGNSAVYVPDCIEWNSTTNATPFPAKNVSWQLLS